MRFNISVFFLLLLLAACSDVRIHEKEEIGNHFKKYGITDAAFILRDHTHESVYFYNKDRTTQRFTPASTFKIFSALSALESATAPDDQYLIAWDSVQRDNPEWNRDMTMREAFKLSNVGYFQELARRTGKDYLQHYLDTVQYGNRRIGPAADAFWLNDTLQISADEQLGFVKKLYFDELPFSERSQRIVRSMMLQEEHEKYKLYYKTGMGNYKDSTIYWVVGFVEKIERVKEHEKSMNKSDVRNYPFFFAQNFSVRRGDNTQNYAETRLLVLKEILSDMSILPTSK